MSSRYTAPALFALEPLVADTLAWTQGEASFVTVVAKLELGWVPGGVARPVVARAIRLRPRHHHKSPQQSLQDAAELVPWLPQPEWYLVGDAVVPGGRAAASMTVQVTIARGEVVQRKRVDVYGDQREPTAPRMPFQRMPLMWERARASELNPVGLRTGIPNLQSEQELPCFGPISPLWPSRATLRRGADVGLDTEPVRIPREFNGAFFHAAPPDQRLSRLVGDEWVALDGFHPALRRMVTRLPGARVSARLFAGDRHLHDVPLSPDRLVFDSNRQRAVLFYRSVLPAVHARMGEQQIRVGSDLGGESMEWPDIDEPSTRCVHHPAPTTLSSDEGEPGGEATGADAAAPPASPEYQAMIDRLKQTLSFDQDSAPRAPQPGRPVRATPFDPVVASEPPPPVVAPEPPPPIVTPEPAPPVVTPEAPAASPPETEPPASALPPPRLTPEAPAVASRPKTEPPVSEGAAREGDAVDTAEPHEPHFAAFPATPFDAKTGQAANPAVLVELSEAAKQNSFGSFDDEVTGFFPVRGGVTALPFGPAGGPAPQPEQAGPEQDIPEPPSVVAPEHAPQSGALGPPAGPRRSDRIPAAAEPGIALASFIWRIDPPQESLVAVVKASFDLRAGQVAELRDKPEWPHGDLYAQGGSDVGGALLAASDFGLAKPRVDVLVKGHAYPPREGATHALAALRFKETDRDGSWQVDKEIAVLGDRAWAGRSPGPAAPFVRIPISHDRSFGGSAHEDNPAGVGVERPPNFEDPKRPMTSPGDKPSVASFAPINRTWAARQSKIGTYDRRWFYSRWPYFAEDLDFAYFQTAPRDQQVDTAIGDERYELQALHPERERITGRLPGLRARCFARLVEEAGGRLIEVPLRLDTITFDSDAGAVHLVWRGHVAVSDDDASEVEVLFACLEPVGEPLSLDAIEARMAAVQDPGPASAPAEGETTPPPSPNEEEEGEDGAPSPVGEESEYLRAMRERIEAMDEGGPAPAIEVPRWTPASVVERLQQIGASDGEIAAAQASLADLEQPEPNPPEPAPDSPRTFVEQRMARGESLAGLSLRGADLSAMNLDGQDLSFSDLTEADLQRTTLLGSTLDGATLVRANLNDAKLGGARFRDVDFTDGVAQRADFDKADLGGATLLRLDATEGNFTACTAVRARFTGAQLTDANFSGAQLTEAEFAKSTIDRVRFCAAEMGEVRLYDVRGEGVDGTAIKADGLRAGRAFMPRAKFDRAQLDDSLWESAVLSEASFQYASMRNASLIRAVATKIVLVGADLRQARMKKCDLSGSRLMKANLMGAQGEKVDCRGADFRGCNLHGSFFFEADMDGARTEGALTTFSTIDRSQP